MGVVLRPGFWIAVILAPVLAFGQAPRQLSATVSPAPAVVSNGLPPSPEIAPAASPEATEEPAVSPTVPQESPHAEVVDDPVDGEPVPAALAARRPLAVVIENHPAARPQWGLSLASRVYEALTEGGITRYLAIFGPRDADRIGPVRSARIQFLDYVLELDAAFAHVGGSANALDLIPELHIRDLNEFRYAAPYRRVRRPQLSFEHTVFASTRALRVLIDRRGWGGPVSIAHPVWKDDPAPDLRPPRQTVTVDFSKPAYRVVWVYRSETNDYQRFLAGVPDTDAATGEVVHAKSIAIAVIPRFHGRTLIGEDTWTFADIGSGRAWVVQDGTVAEGRWQKPSRADRLRFLGPAGEEQAFDRGQQWVEIVPPEVAPVVAAAASR